ncbi:MAG: ATP-binding cassette domain-containing protein [Anaerolineae bacterium]|nr:ATP-binding cassette domain-containing protein [Anaerolineae bacterium]
MQTIITVEDVHFEYTGEGGKGSPALQGVSLEIHEGEFTVLLGANGSGKTTLARHLNGLLTPTSGRVQVGRLDTRERANLGSIRQRVGMVFQHPENQIIATTVEEDVAFGPENLGLAPAEIRQRVDAAIEAVGLDAHRQRSPHLLSAGQMQRLALAGVLAMRPRCVIFDEATTMLDPAGRRMALELMTELRSAGMAVMFVTHNMQEVALADRAVVLASGRKVFEGTPRELFQRGELESWGLERPPAAALALRLGHLFGEDWRDVLSVAELLERLPASRKRCPSPAATHVEVHQPDAILQVQDLEHTYMLGTPLAYAALQGVDLAVRQGRAHGLIGVTGAGKSTLLQHLNGLLRPQKGSVTVLGLDLSDPQVTTRQVTRRVGLVMQNPEMQFFEQYVGDEIAYGPKQIDIDESLAARVRWSMEQVGLDFEQFKDRFTTTLSGGEKRKVALASLLAIKPEVLLLDEPTAGLDPHARSDVLRTLRRLGEEGMSVVLSSHVMEDVAALAADVTAFRKGQTALAGSAGEVFWDFERLNEIGLEAPVSARVAARLSELGWPIPRGVIIPDTLMNVVQSCLEGTP